MKKSILTLGVVANVALAVAPPAAGAADDVLLTPEQAMMWKYTARCALRADQTLEAPAAASGGAPVIFKGEMGLAPEWRDGTCDRACQERVSSCLLALINPTGQHVPVNLLSAAPSLAAIMSPNDNDLAFPVQEGAFFGNVFAGEAYVCRGHDAAEGIARQRFCAADPARCRDAAGFADAGRCDDACKMTCSRLSDGTRRCVAVRCRDPKGRLWKSPITTYLRAGAAR